MNYRPGCKSFIIDTLYSLILQAKQFQRNSLVSPFLPILLKEQTQYLYLCPFRYFAFDQFDHLTTTCYRPEVLQNSFQYNPIVQGVDRMEFRPKRFAKENQHILRGLNSNRGTPKVTEGLRLFGTIQTTVLFSHPSRIHIIFTIKSRYSDILPLPKRVRYHNTVNVL